MTVEPSPALLRETRSVFREGEALDVRRKKNMIKASLEDIPILDGYLHDSYFKPDEVKFDSDKRCFAMDLERVCYERADPGKVLWFIPVIRYPWILSHLTMRGVEEIEQKVVSSRLDGPDGKQQLMDIVQKSDNHIELGSHGTKITLTLSSDFVLTLEDVPDSITSSRITDFSKGIFYGMDEINKLKIDA